MSKTLKLLQVSLCLIYLVVICQILNAVNNKYEEIVELNYLEPTPGLIKKMHRELKMHLIKQPNGTMQVHTPDYRKPNRLPTDLKFILKFSTAYSHFGNPAFQDGQGAFIERKCKYINCVFTNNINLMLDIRNFDAVLLDVEHEWEGHHPLFRSPEQKYIFSATESADYYPICNPVFDNYYNLTWTYKLDSDIQWTYFTILNRTGHKVGPKFDMTWIDYMDSTTDDVKNKLAKKSKAAAWFVSNCRSKSPRLKIAEKIQKELQPFGHKVDIYGYCGNLTCPKDSHADCLEILQEYYYFYFVFENSLSEDYVTEKLLYAVNHYTVPVVFGGSNYSRFLPPGSYINAGTSNAKKVAEHINEAIRDKTIYYDYFRWHNHYTYKPEPEVSNICALCQHINELTDHMVVKNFRKWWYPHFETRCKEPNINLYGKDPRV